MKLFQLTRSRGAWLILFWLRHSVCIFQLTRSRGAWRGQEFEIWESRKDFNSHAHVERDTFVSSFPKKSMISTHTLTWSVTSPKSTEPKFLSFQLTRSRGAWQPLAPLQPRHNKISTHTLTWSVTFLTQRQTQTLFISTHTLTWSVTISPGCKSKVPQFQLTRSRGAWPTVSLGQRCGQ